MPDADRQEIKERNPHWLGMDTPAGLRGEGLRDAMPTFRVPELTLYGRVAAAWLDSLEPGALDVGRPLAGMDSGCV